MGAVPASGGPAAGGYDVVCCSLEPWDRVWRRNQHFASRVLGQRADLRILFVELAVDIPWSVRDRRVPARSRLRRIGDSGRLWAMAPRKWLPRSVWSGVDESLGRQVRAAVGRLDLHRPVLWINDSTYAPLAAATGWPVVYDVTDDWLLAGHSESEAERQARHDAYLVQHADEVVVCSPALAASRGAGRMVRLIPNGVDLDRLRRPEERPADLPAGPTVLYTGTLHADRLDVELSVDLAGQLRGSATVVFVGPNSLSGEDTARLEAAGAVLLGARPYDRMPGYLQHADVLVVPHRVTPFTESLDPIKARELQAVARPAVTTPVAGLRGLGPPTTVVPADGFVTAVREVLARPTVPPGPGPLAERPGSWAERATEFLDALDAAAAHWHQTGDGECGRGARRGPTPSVPHPPEVET